MRRRLFRNLIDGTLAIKQRGRLLQRPVLGLHDEQPTKDNLKGEPAHVHDLTTVRSESVTSLDRAEGRT